MISAKRAKNTHRQDLIINGELLQLILEVLAQCTCPQHAARNDWYSRASITRKSIIRTVNYPNHRTFQLLVTVMKYH